MTAKYRDFKKVGGGGGVNSPHPHSVVSVQKFVLHCNYTKLPILPIHFGSVCLLVQHVSQTVSGL